MLCPSVCPSPTLFTNGLTYRNKLDVYVEDTHGFPEFKDVPCRTTFKGSRPRAHPHELLDIGKWGIAEKLRIRVKQWRQLKFEILHYRRANSNLNIYFHQIGLSL